jgi:hypothetical protein
VRRRKRKLSLQSVVGQVSVETDYGQDPGTKQWLCPQRQIWGLSAHQKITPLLAEKVCFTVTATGSYSEAAAVAEKWGSAVDDSTLHALVQKVGARIEEQTIEQLQCLPQEIRPQSRPSELGVLMLDGWMVRHRGEGWGKRSTKKPRVEWHEMKMGLYYPHEQSAQKGHRGLLAAKVIVAGQQSPCEIGARLHWQGLRAGLGRAKELMVLADGAGWIWNLKEQRWRQAHELLDFYHASQHLWDLGKALLGEAHAAKWVEPRLHRLRHGRHKQVVGDIAALVPPQGETGLIIKREQGYFAQQQHRINYKAAADKGWPIGSGAIESACRQKQMRFKRCGQFWTRSGLRHLCALEIARTNGHWPQIW